MRCAVGGFSTPPSPPPRPEYKLSSSSRECLAERQRCSSWVYDFSLANGEEISVMVMGWRNVFGIMVRGWGLTSDY